MGVRAHLRQACLYKRDVSDPLHTSSKRQGALAYPTHLHDWRQSPELAVRQLPAGRLGQGPVQWPLPTAFHRAPVSPSAEEKRQRDLPGDGRDAGPAYRSRSRLLQIGEELRRMRTWSRLLELQCLRACLVRSPSGPPTQLRSAGCLPRRAAREAVPAGTAHCGRGVGRRSIDRGPVPHGLLAREVRHVLVQRRRRVLVDAPLRLDAWLARRDVVGDPEAVAGK